MSMHHNKSRQHLSRRISDRKGAEGIPSSSGNGCAVPAGFRRPVVNRFHARGVQPNVVAKFSIRALADQLHEGRPG